MNQQSPEFHLDVKEVSIRRDKRSSVTNRAPQWNEPKKVEVTASTPSRKDHTSEREHRLQHKLLAIETLLLWRHLIPIHTKRKTERVITDWSNISGRGIAQALAKFAKAAITMIAIITVPPKKAIFGERFM